MPLDDSTPDSINEKTLTIWYRTMRKTLSREEATRRVLQALTHKIGRKLAALTFHTPDAKAEAVQQVQDLYERLKTTTDMDDTPTLLDHVHRIIPEAHAAYRQRNERRAA